MLTLTLQHVSGKHEIACCLNIGQLGHMMILKPELCDGQLVADENSIICLSCSSLWSAAHAFISLSTALHDLGTAQAMQT